MTQALELAAQGRGHVEPNPMVGCVIVEGTDLLASGYHRKFGGPHAEVEALQAVGNRSLADATMFVTLEPCSHHGKTPPCTDAIIASGIRRVVCATEDPFRDAAGQGIQRLRQAGIECECGILAAAAEKLNAPYFQRVRTGIPWFIAKWAMTLDGRIASQPGSDRWISNESSRAAAHEIRGRMDAIVIGRITFEHDDPQLTARPPGPRSPARIILASQGIAYREGQILASPTDPVTIVVVDPVSCAKEHQELMRSWGCQVLAIPQLKTTEGLVEFARQLGAMAMTNVMVEGGPTVLRSFAEAGLFREYHLFLAPDFYGSRLAPDQMQDCAGDLYWRLS